MCGRFTLTKDMRLIMEYYNFKSKVDYKPRYNIAPSQNILAVVGNRGQREPIMLKWGLIPSWAKDKSIGNKMINARGETVDVKPSFSRLLKTRRCLIPADGFYEWKSNNDQKIPMRIIKKDKGIFSLAGLWDEWVSPEGIRIQSCTIITTSPNELIREVHHRMPVILTPQGEDAWLDSSITDTGLLKSLLVPYPAEEMAMYQVSRLVNNPANDIPECVKAVGEEQLSFFL